MSDDRKGPIEVGDYVEIRVSPETESRGFAGLVGKVWENTLPPSMDVEVIGEIREGGAIQVYFEARRQDVWFARELVVPSPPAADARAHAATKKWTRNAEGQWVEAPEVSAAPPKKT